MTAQETAGHALRRYFRIGPRSPRWRRGRDLHVEMFDAIRYAATQPGYFTTATESALRPAYAVALSWDKHVNGYRLPGQQAAALAGLTPYQLTVLIDRMVSDGITNVGEGERWFRAHRDHITEEAACTPPSS